MLEEGRLPLGHGSGEVLMRYVGAERPHQDAVGDERRADDNDPIESQEFAAAQAASPRSLPERVERGSEKEDHQRGHARDAGPEHVGGAEQDLPIERGRSDQGNENQPDDDDSPADPASSIAGARHGG
jgi:hypothetical protein